MLVPKFFHTYRRHLILFALCAVGIGAYVLFYSTQKAPDVPIARVERGSIEQLVSISGTVDFTQNADLTFSANGTVASVLVREGDEVEAEQVLATLDQKKHLADMRDALAYLAIQRANYDELVRGPSTEAQAVSTAAVALAEGNVARITREQDELVRNARRTLFSTDLVATPVWKDNADTPPTISGTYTCDSEGTYTLSVYRSRGVSGYSYRLSGLETDTDTAYTDSPQSLGTCGLYIQFADDVSYGNQDWTIEIPNTRSTSFVTQSNAYSLALEKQKTAVAVAKDELVQASAGRALENATPRDEALARANANIEQASARIEVIDADIENRTIRAPFSGTITDVSFLVGETSDAKKMTLVAKNSYELTVRIPEIDITKVSIGDLARVSLDANASEILTAHITFISPLATEIDGVSYYEAHLTFDTTPDWFRGGLNADVDIVTDIRNDALKLPSRYIQTIDGIGRVVTKNGDKVESRDVGISFRGSDGFVEVTGVPLGLEVILP